MLSNQPLERLLTAMMALDARAEHPDYAIEMRCLLRKLEWAAQEAETTLKRLETAPAANVAVEDEAREPAFA